MERWIVRVIWVFLLFVFVGGVLRLRTETLSAQATAETAGPSCAKGVEMSNTRNSSTPSPTPSTPLDQAYLDSQGWKQRVDAGLGAWVSVNEQLFRVIRGGQVIWQVKCSTAAKGTGFDMGSEKTPLGWHSVAKKIGAGAPWGQVFRARQTLSKEIWRPGVKTDEDLVLTRILMLSGEEPGKNKGGNVDSLDRGIYIHGTSDEARIGTPSSHGCVRLRNDDVIKAFDMLPEGTPVLITERRQ